MESVSDSGSHPVRTARSTRHQGVWLFSYWVSRGVLGRLSVVIPTEHDAMIAQVSRVTVVTTAITTDQ